VQQPRVKFHHKAGEIVISTRAVEKEEESVHTPVLVFRDTGVGLTKSRRGNCFRFFMSGQITSTTRKKYGGTGLGLTNLPGG